MANTSSNGYYWSSSPNYGGNNNAGNLNFNSGNVNPLNNNNRANGFSVRCVQASARPSLRSPILPDMPDEKLLADVFSAYYDARRNKRNTYSQLRFEMNLEENLVELYREIDERRYRVGRSMCFITDIPVKREIFAADFRDRVMPFGVTVISAGSKTTPGGYAHPNRELEQWSINDNRTPREVEAAVRAKGLDPVWKDWSFFMQEEVETPALLTHSA